LQIGDFLCTPAGSAYLVQSMRQNRNQPQRRHLECVRWPLVEIPAEATVYEFYWYPRYKRRSRTLASLST
jgi:hypothetical protein